MNVVKIIFDCFSLEKCNPTTPGYQALFVRCNQTLHFSVPPLWSLGKVCPESRVFVNVVHFPSCLLGGSEVASGPDVAREPPIKKADIMVKR